MRVVIFTETSLWGGLETHAVTLAKALVGMGHQAAVVCLDSRACELFRNALPAEVPVLHVAPPKRRTVWGWQRALRHVDADAALLEKGTLFMGGFALDCALRLKYARFVAYQQLEPPPLPPRTSKRYLGGLIPGAGLWWYRWRYSGFLRSLGPHVTVCVSDAVRRALATDYLFAERKLVPIPHGVDLEQFRPDVSRRNAARAAWGIPDGAFVFGSVRRFVRDKGLDVLIEAFAQLASDSADDLRLVLVGEGPEREALSSLAERLGVAKSVVFAGFDPSPWTLYPALDVFVIPSRIEALGVVVIEAMACQCLLIASRVGGIPEMVPDPSLGTLVPPDDAGALAAAMRQALAMDAATRSATLARARAHVAEHFDMHKQSAKIAALLAPR
jgi:glycosyltransferase involved in cell wall biosynthesis